jgi:hypothetical protein
MQGSMKPSERSGMGRKYRPNPPSSNAQIDAPLEDRAAPMIDVTPISGNGQPAISNYTAGRS